MLSHGRLMVEDTLENLTREMSLEQVFLRAVSADRDEPQDLSSEGTE